MLHLTIKDDDGFTIGPDIVVKLMQHDHRSKSTDVAIEAPRHLAIGRVDKPTANYLLMKLKPVDRRAPPQTPNLNPDPDCRCGHLNSEPKLCAQCGLIFMRCPHCRPENCQSCRRAKA